MTDVSAGLQAVQIPAASKVPSRGTYTAVSDPHALADPTRGLLFLSALASTSPQRGTRS